MFLRVQTYKTRTILMVISVHMFILKEKKKIYNFLNPLKDQKKNAFKRCRENAYIYKNMIKIHIGMEMLQPGESEGTTELERQTN